MLFVRYVLQTFSDYVVKIKQALFLSFILLKDVFKLSINN